MLSFLQETLNIFSILKNTHILDKDFLLILSQKLFWKFIQVIFNPNKHVFMSLSNTTHDQAIEKTHDMSIAIITNPSENVRMIVRDMLDCL